MKSNNLLKVYTVFITLIALALWIETRNLNIQLDEEIEIKYEYSAIIDSLLNEQNPLQHEKESNTLAN